MRILQIASSLRNWGGIEKYVAILCEGLTELGHEVCLAAPSNSPLIETAKCESVAIGQSGQFDTRSIRGYKTLLSDRTFDVANVHFSPDYVVPVRAVRRFGRCPIALTRHVAVPWGRLKAWTYRSTVDRFVAVSNAVASSMVLSGIPNSSIDTVYAGVPSSPQRQEPPNERRSLRVGFIGRLSYEKGVDTLIRAMASIPGDSRLEIYGDGPQRSALEQMASAMPRITFHGWVDDVSKALSQVDVVAATSRWQEAFPLSVLEAMAAGKPVVGTRSGGIVEQIEEGVNGFLVEIDGAEKLASKLRLLLESDDMRRRMGEAALSRHRERFTVHAFARRMESVYGSMVKEL